MSLIKFFYTAMTHDRHRKCIIILFKKNKKGIIISFQAIFFSFQYKIFNILNKKSPRKIRGQRYITVRERIRGHHRQQEPSPKSRISPL